MIVVNLFHLVVPLLHRYLSTAASSSAVSEQALRCFSSWAQFGLPLPDSEPLIALAFVALRSESHFDVAVDALSSVFSHPDNHRSLAADSVSLILSLLSHFTVFFLVLYYYVDCD